MKKSQTIVIGIIVLVIVLALGGWYAYSNPRIADALGLRHGYGMGGMMQDNYGPNNSSTTPGRFAGMRGGFATGSIEVLNDNGFTLTLSDGTTEVVDITATTTLQNYATASSTPTTITKDQLSVGEQVSVIGIPQADGSIAAREVRTGAAPTMPMGQGRGGPGGGMYGHGSSTPMMPPPTATN
jgi:hypothetical protein